MDYSTIWQQVLNYIKESKIVDDASFSTWMKMSILTEIAGNQAFVVVPSSIHKKFMMEYKENFEEHLKTILNVDEILLSFFLKEEMGHLYPEFSVTTKQLLQTKLNEEYTFNNFITGGSNREAHAAALLISNNPGSYNPVFIYGNSGLGKTHLLHAIGNHIKDENSRKAVFLTNSSDFIDLLIDAMGNKNVSAVKDMILDYDYFLIDDIQLLKANASQEIFFELYNKMISMGKQVVITSDIHPEELKGIADRLITRFTSGLTSKIDSPEFETARAILNRNVATRIGNRNENFLIHDDVLDFIALRFREDVRKLEGALNKLYFNAIMSPDEDIDLSFAMKVFKDNPLIMKEEDLSANKIKKAVCDFYGLTKAQIESKSRTANISNARHIAIYLCRDILEMSYAKIGAEFGNRDHSTIIASQDKVKKLLKTDTQMKQAISMIKKNLGRD